MGIINSPFVKKPSLKKLKKLKFDLIYQNVRGLKGKLVKTKNVLATLPTTLIALTETRLDESVHDGELFPSDYSVLRKDRVCGRGGGVLLAARAPYVVHRLDSAVKSSDELVLAHVSKGNFKFICCVVYIPPRVVASRYYSIFEYIEELNNSYQLPIVIIGDFNLYSTTTAVRRDFQLLLSDCGLTQQNSVVNSLNRILDLVLTNSLVVDITVAQACTGLVSFEKHHFPLDISISFQSPHYHVSIPINPNATPSRNFRKCNFPLLYHELMHADWSPLYNINDPEVALTFLYSTLDKIFDQTVPWKRTSKNTHRYPTWFTPDIIQLNTLKNYYHKLFKLQNDQLYYAFFTYYRKLTNTKIEVSRCSYFDTIETGIRGNPSSFWSFIKQNRRSAEPATFENMTNQEIADAFASFFHSVFIPNKPQLNVSTALASVDNGNCSLDVSVCYITESEINRALAKLQPKFTEGPDGIPQVIVRDCKDIFVKPLTHIFNLIIKSKTYPAAWKISRVIPLHKNGPKGVVSNYRPIAILSVFSKTFESIMYRSIYNQLRGWLCSEQHGFLPGRSTSTNLLNLTTFLASNMTNKLQTDITYFDFKKAFDRVDNDTLLIKMAQAGFSTDLLELFSSYLSNRLQYVQYRDSHSEHYSVTSGIGQGSSLGPLLFLILINDLPSVVHNAMCLIYADDIKLACSIRNSLDCAKLQSDINSVVAWSRDNRLELNTAKCAVMTYSRARDPTYALYCIDGGLLNRVQTIRDLGTWFDRHVSFSHNAVELCRQVRKALGYIMRQTQCFKTRGAHCVLYNSFVRSRLETNGLVWNPYQRCYIELIEKVQKTFVRYLYKKVYGYYPYMYPTPFVLGMVEYRTLEVRRNISLVKYIHRLLRGCVHNPVLLAQIPFNISIMQKCRLRARCIPLFRTPNVVHPNNPLFRALEWLNILCGDYGCDIFVGSESKFLDAAGAYFESIARPTSIK